MGAREGGDAAIPVQDDLERERVEHRFRQDEAVLPVAGEESRPESPLRGVRERAAELAMAQRLVQSGIGVAERRASVEVGDVVLVELQREGDPAPQRGGRVAGHERYLVGAVFLLPVGLLVGDVRQVPFDVAAAFEEAGERRLGVRTVGPGHDAEMRRELEAEGVYHLPGHLVVPLEAASSLVGESRRESSPAG